MTTEKREWRERVLRRLTDPVALAEQNATVFYAACRELPPAGGTPDRRAENPR